MLEIDAELSADVAAMDAAIHAFTQDDTLAGLAQMHELRRRLDAAEIRLVGRARRQHKGWEQIADALGLSSRQVAHRKYAPLMPR